MPCSQILDAGVRRAICVAALPGDSSAFALMGGGVSRMGHDRSRCLCEAADARDLNQPATAHTASLNPAFLHPIVDRGARNTDRFRSVQHRAADRFHVVLRRLTD